MADPIQPDTTQPDTTRPAAAPAEPGVDAPDPIEAVEDVEGAVRNLVDTTAAGSPAADRLRENMARLAATAENTGFRESLHRLHQPGRDAGPDASESGTKEEVTFHVEIDEPADEASANAASHAESTEHSPPERGAVAPVDELAAERALDAPEPRESPVEPEPDGAASFDVVIEEPSASLDDEPAASLPETKPDTSSPRGPEPATDAAASTPTSTPEIQAEADGPAEARPFNPAPRPDRSIPKAAHTDAQAPPTGPSTYKQTDVELTEIDRALAGDLDSLLSSDLEAVSDVLDEIFDDSAVVVQEIDDDLAVLPEFQDAIAADEAARRSRGGGDAPGIDAPDIDGPGTDATGTEPAPADGPPHATANDVPPATTAPGPKDAQPADVDARPDRAPVPVVGSTAPDVIAEPPAAPRPLAAESGARGEVSDAPVVEDGSPAETPDDVPVLTIDEPDADIDIDFDDPAVTTTLDPALAIGRAAEEPPAEAHDAPDENGWLPRLLAVIGRLVGRVGSPVWRVAGPPVVRVLEGANYPLRHVPEGVRPVVDWLALSLLLWVPIVWAIAILLTG